MPERSGEEAGGEDSISRVSVSMPQAIMVGPRRYFGRRPTAPEKESHGMERMETARNRIACDGGA